MDNTHLAPGAMIHLVYRAAQHADSVFARAMAEWGLTPRQYALLMAVSSAEGLNQNDIVDATGIDRATTAYLVKSLVTKGWLQRVRVQNNVRSYAVTLTARGRDIMFAAQPAAALADDQLLAKLPAASRSTLVDALTLLIEEEEIG